MKLGLLRDVLGGLRAPQTPHAGGPAPQTPQRRARRMLRRTKLIGGDDERLSQGQGSMPTISYRDKLPSMRIPKLPEAHLHPYADTYNAALHYVNEIRTHQGRPRLAELPKGRRMSGNGCVIANALNLDSTMDCVVGGSGSVTTSSQNGAINFKSADSLVKSFIIQFDNDRFPELVQHLDEPKPTLKYDKPGIKTVYADDVMNWREKIAMKLATRKAQKEIDKELTAKAQIESLERQLTLDVEKSPDKSGAHTTMEDVAEELERV